MEDRRLGFAEASTREKGNEMGVVGGGGLRDLMAMGPENGLRVRR